MKRFLIVACAVLCTISLVGCSGNNQNFTNVDPSKEYYEAIKSETTSDKSSCFVSTAIYNSGYFFICMYSSNLF